MALQYVFRIKPDRYFYLYIYFLQTILLQYTVGIVNAHLIRLEYSVYITAFRVDRKTKPNAETTLIIIIIKLW